MSHTIPIFFSTDENYLPYLDVAVSSLIANASAEYDYRIIVLNTGLSESNVQKVKQREREGFKIDFVDISDEMSKIQSRFKNVYHFSVATYYRLFIASLFPQYDKVIYLDCDLVVTGDISELYRIDLGDNVFGAAPEQFVQSTKEFRTYAEKALGVDPDGYVNAGVLLISLEKFRENGIEEKFIRLISEYDFDLLDPDQAYLNYLCLGKIHTLPIEWNKEPLPDAYSGEKKIVHYALYKKPWQYDDVMYGDLFWLYAKESPFYGLICVNRQNFGPEEIAKKEETAKEILEHALKIAESENTFSTRLCRC